MRKGFTLIECMIAGAILVLVTTAFMKALSVINRVEHENAQYMEADAILWDAIAETFTNDYQHLRSIYSVLPDGQSNLTVCVKNESLVKGGQIVLRADLHIAFDGECIRAWIDWGNGKYSLTNEVMRSEYARRKEE